GMTGKNMRPAKAKALGVADDVVPLPILRDVATRLALSLAEGETKRPSRKEPVQESLARPALEQNPVGRAVLFRKATEQLLKRKRGHSAAPERVLEVLKSCADDGFDASREVEARAFGELVVSDTAHQLMNIFFATTALKKDTGVDDLSVKPRKVEKV